MEDDSYLSKVVNRWRFSGYYKGFWQKRGWIWTSTMGVLDVSIPDLEFEVNYLKERAVSELGIGSIYIERGFITHLAREKDLKTLQFPEVEDIKDYDNAIILCSKDSEIYKLFARYKTRPVNAVNEVFRILYNGKKLYIIASPSKEKCLKLYHLIEKTIVFLRKYRLYKGWPFYFTGYYTITPRVEHPIDAILKAIRQGCSWMFLIGPYENLTVKYLRKWLKEAKINFVVVSGQLSSDSKAIMLDLEEYPSYQTCPLDVCLKWHEKMGGYLFLRFATADAWRELSPKCYDGLVFENGNSDFIDNVEKPFIIAQRLCEWEDIPASMIIFIPRDNTFTKEELFKAILDKRAIGIFPRGHIVGPEEYRKIFYLLILEEEYLCKSFEKKVRVDLDIDDNKLAVKIHNYSNKNFKGMLELNSSPGLLLEDVRKEIQISKGCTTIAIPLRYTSKSAGETLVVGATLTWNGSKSFGLAYLNLPDAITMPPMLYRYSDDVDIVATIYNYGYTDNVKVRAYVYKNGTLLTSKEFTFRIKTKSTSNVHFKLDLSPGRYDVVLEAFEKKSKCMLIVDKPCGKVKWSKVDYDNDGLEEIILENEHIKAVILPWGGRVIRLYLKDRDTNLLFKVWPKKPINWRKPSRKSEFWPYGGLEEFINYPTVDGHVPFSLKIIKATVHAVSVEASADIHGNKITKIFTIYGGLPLLEVIYRIEPKNIELNVLGVNPLIKIGEVCDENHIFIFPTREGLQVKRFIKTKNYGEFFNLSEGWVAGYDEEEDIALITIYPPHIPFVTHLWMNTPQNPSSHHYYVEIQPWVKLKQCSTNYFAYYMYGYSGNWCDALKDLKRKNLIITK